MTEAAVVDALATYRLTRLVISDTFPPVRRAREAVLSRYKADSWQVELGICSWCMSVWIAAGVLVVRRSRPWREFLAPALAASAVAGVLSERYG